MSGTKSIADPDKCFQEFISEKLLILLREGRCLELVIDSSNGGISWGRPKSSRKQSLCSIFKLWAICFVIKAASWPLRRSWSQPLWYLTKVTIVPPPPPRVWFPLCRLWSYLACNGDTRFQSGATPHANGEWFSSHNDLDAFASGLHYVFLIPRIGQGHSRVTWLRRLGPPSSLQLGRGILIPEWGFARQRLLTLSRDHPSCQH